MKKFFANLGAGNYYDESGIEEVEYDHFERISEATIIGYDGDILPSASQRRSREIRFSLFFDNTLYDTLAEAETYLINTLKDHLNQIKEELTPLQAKYENIKNVLSKYEN